MDTIWNTAVGIDIDCQNNPDNEYLHKALHVFKDLEDLKFAFIVTSLRINKFNLFQIHSLIFITLISLFERV
jgi:hypothetical protein